MSFTKFKQFLQRYPNRKKPEFVRIEDKDRLPLDLACRLKFRDRRTQNLALKLSVLWDEHDEHINAQHRILQFNFSKQVALKAQMEFLCDPNI